MLELIGATENYLRLFVWLGVLWALIIVLGASLWYYRRRWIRSGSGEEAAPWTLADLRQLRDSGDLSEEEYQRIRSAMIAGVRSSANEAGIPGPARKPPGA